MQYKGTWVSGLLLVLFLLSAGAVQPLYGQESEMKDPVVWKVGFDGNQSYSRMVLKDIIATESPGMFRKLIGRTGNFLFNENEVRRDAIRLQRYYRRRGFVEASVTWELEEGSRPWKRHVQFLIEEGEPVLIRSVEIVIDASTENEEVIRNTRDFDRAVRRHDFQPGNRYEEIRSADVEGLFIRVMEEAGFAYAELEIDVEIDEGENRADIRLIGRPGPRTTFDKIEIDGELTVDERIVSRETTIRSGELYSRTKMQQSQRELFNHHLFRFATVSLPEQPQDSTLDVTIRIREHPLRSVEASLGVGREEYIRGQLTWLHRNLFNVGHRFSVSGRASFIDQRAGIDYLIPYVFNPKSSFVSGPYVQHRIEPGFELFRAGFTNSLIYQFSSNLTSSATYEMTINEELSGRSGTSLPDTVLAYNTASMVFSGYYSQGLARGEEGWVVRPSLEISSLLGEGSYEYQRGSVDVRKYTRLSSDLTLAKRVQVGALYTATEDSIPANIRFFRGGTNSVRGWNRQMLGPKQAVFDEEDQFDGYRPVGGRATFIFNIELRQRLDALFNGLGMALFFDGGQVWRNFSDFNPFRVETISGTISESNTRALQFGLGGGLSYDSPIGPVRFDLGYKLNPTDADLNRYQGVDYGGQSRWTIHFSIGQAF